MAVIVKYIVVRNGEEKMTFATKKEADAYDKMLDIADNLFEFLDKSELKLPEDQMEQISLLLAENRDVVMPILRGVNPKKPAPAKSKKTSEKSSDDPKAGKTADNPAPRQKPGKK
jgi:hypothetical protein